MQATPLWECAAKHMDSELSAQIGLLTTKRAPGVPQWEEEYFFALLEHKLMCRV